MVKNEQHMIMYKLLFCESDDDIPLAHLPSTSAMHSRATETESESIIECDSEDDQTIANIPTKMANKDQLTDQNHTNKVRKDAPSLCGKQPPHFANSTFTGKPFPRLITPEVF